MEHRFIPVERADRVDALVGELRGQRDLALVFVRTKRGADRLAKRLRSSGLAADAMHGDKSQGQRERTLANFERGRVNVLVATDVAARGIHVEGISHVINFDPPEDRDGYVHRIGRTARAGETGVGITFVGTEQAHDVRQIASQLKLHAEFERSGLGSRRASSHHPSPGAHRKPTAGATGAGAAIAGRPAAPPDRAGILARCSSPARTSATSPSSRTWTTARRRWSTPCSGSPAPSAPTRTWPSA